MDTPKHLSHTPIVSWNDYHRKDGKFANKTDAMALLIGYAQYDKKERDQINLESDNRVRKQDISMKVWRKPGDRWSRQSEEILQIKKNCISLQGHRGIRRRDDNPYRSGGSEPQSLATAFLM